MTARPPRISGVALSRVSEIGPRIATPPSEYSESVLKTEPRNNAAYPAEIAFQALLNVSDGASVK